MTCKNSHLEADAIVASLPINQGGKGRHKCASCAYERGVKNGKKRHVGFDIAKFIDSLEESQKGPRRHKDPLEAYTIGFFHGLSGKTKHTIIEQKFQLSTNMAKFGMVQVGKGLYECTFEENTPFSHALSTVHVASGFELILKARIAQEHPYLIFEKLPTQAKVKRGKIELDDLLEHGHTITYSELPERLWVTTGEKIPDIKLYNKFGKVRNQIIHFATPNLDYGRFVYEYWLVNIEPLVNDWWDDTILNFAWAHDTGFPDYVFKRIEDFGLKVGYAYDNEKHAFKKI